MTRHTSSTKRRHRLPAPTSTSASSRSKPVSTFSTRISATCSSDRRPGRTHPHRRLHLRRRLDRLQDILVEIWQANAAGRYNHPADRQRQADRPSFRGWGRTGTDFHIGVYAFETVKPGPVAGRTGARRWRRTSTSGLRLAASTSDSSTRMYFADEAAATRRPGLTSSSRHAAADADRPRTERDGEIVYMFDIHLQGDRETVFFDI